MRHLDAWLELARTFGRFDAQASGFRMEHAALRVLDKVEETELHLYVPAKYDPSKPATYPNGRVFTDDVIDHRLAFLTKGECPPTGLKPHSDVLSVFPYLGHPHPK